MTREEWLACKDLAAMFADRRGNQVSERKLRLFACGCCRRVWRLLADDRSWRMIEVIERDADRQGNRGDAEHNDARAAAWEAATAAACAANANTPAQAATFAADAVLQAAYCESVAEPAYDAAFEAAVQAIQEAEVAQTATGRLNPVRESGAAWENERAAQCSLLRDIAGDSASFTSVESALRTPTILSLTQAIYEERAFERMPILADALEDAGVADPDILTHCRGLGPHVRGCWVVDLILGKA